LIFTNFEGIIIIDYGEKKKLKSSHLTFYTLEANIKLDYTHISPFSIHWKQILHFTILVTVVFSKF